MVKISVPNITETSVFSLTEQLMTKKKKKKESLFLFGILTKKKKKKKEEKTRKKQHRIMLALVRKKLKNFYNIYFSNVLYCIWLN